MEILNNGADIPANKTVRDRETTIGYKIRIVTENDDVQFGRDDSISSITDLETSNDSKEEPEVLEPKLRQNIDEPVDTGRLF